MLFIIPEVGLFHTLKLLGPSTAQRQTYSAVFIYRQAPVDGTALCVSHCQRHYRGFGAPDAELISVHDGVPWDATRKVSYATKASAALLSS